MLQNDIEAHRQKLIDKIKREAYFREKIILSSGKESDHYFDLRRITLTPEGAYLSSLLILNEVKDELIDAIGGPTLGADPMLGAISVLSMQSDTPLNTFIIRKSPKKHGRQQLIEGPFLKPGSRVILIDDVATSGKAFLESIDIIKHQDWEIVNAICILDREEGAQEALAKREVNLISLIKSSEIHNPADIS